MVQSLYVRAEVRGVGHLRRTTALVQAPDHAVEISASCSWVDVRDPRAAARAVNIAIAIKRRVSAVVVGFVPAGNGLAACSQRIADDRGPDMKALGDDQAVGANHKSAWGSWLVSQPELAYTAPTLHGPKGEMPSWYPGTKTKSDPVPDRQCAAVMRRSCLGLCTTLAVQKWTLPSVGPAKSAPTCGSPAKALAAGWDTESELAIDVGPHPAISNIVTPKQQRPSRLSCIRPSLTRRSDVDKSGSVCTARYVLLVRTPTARNYSRPVLSGRSAPDK